ncbi:MAG: hemerythrin domain-containing protein [archaeon]
MEDFIESLKAEHEDIERELMELEVIAQSQIVNYSNLLHVFKKIVALWDHHEKKEELIFPKLKRSNILIPVEKMLFDHRELKPYKDTIKRAIESGSEFEVKRALRVSGKVISEKLREHIQDEENALFSAVLDQYTKEELNKIWAG